MEKNLIFLAKQKFPSVISIMGEEVEVMGEYKCLIVHLKNRLDGRQKGEAVFRRDRADCSSLGGLGSSGFAAKIPKMYEEKCTR